MKKRGFSRREWRIAVNLVLVLVFGLVLWVDRGTPLPLTMEFSRMERANLLPASRVIYTDEDDFVVGVRDGAAVVAWLPGGRPNEWTLRRYLAPQGEDEVWVVPLGRFWAPAGTLVFGAPEADRAELELRLCSKDGKEYAVPGQGEKCGRGMYRFPFIKEELWGGVYSNLMHYYADGALSAGYTLRLYDAEGTLCYEKAGTTPLGIPNDAKLGT